MLKKRYFKTKDECEVTFEVVDEAAQLVQLVCEVNGWEPIDMKRTKAGPFRTRVRLPKDADVRFRYVADGDRWFNEESADRQEDNEYGSENSIVSTVSA